MGCIYRRGKVYWVRYYRNGKPHAESTHSKKLKVAKEVLKQREGEISKGEIPGIYFAKVRFDELADDFLADYRVNGKKTLERAEFAKKNLADFFGGMRVTEISTAKIQEYIEKRMEKGLANGSNNRELAGLKRMFHLGAQCTPPKVGQIPYLPMLKESNVRKGFFEHNEFLALRAALPDYLKSVVTFAYHTGWRKSEILNLTWSKVDVQQGIVRLDPGETKNDEARTLYLNEELLKEIHGLFTKRRLGCPSVFHRNGHPFRDFRDSWEKACKTAGLWAMDEKKERMAPTRLFHDFRRTGIRNMIRSGIPERVAMMVSGHKTRTVFDRYNIVSQEDLKEAARKQQAYLKNQTVIADSYNLVTIDLKKASMRKRPMAQVIDFIGGAREGSRTPKGFPTGS